MPLSKTDFTRFLQCPKSLWLLKHRPDDYPHGEPSAYARKLAAEGTEVEAYVRQHIETCDDADLYSFQTAFETQRGLHARADMVRNNDDGSINLYEVKSSTSVKANQIKDACFQMLVAQELGHRVDQVFIVHLNGEYARDGDIDPDALLTFTDVTERVREAEEATQQEITSALTLLAQDEIDETSCSCLQLSRSNHCDSFGYFNPNIPSSSIYDLPRVSKPQLENFTGGGRFSLGDIQTREVTQEQVLVLQSAQSAAPQIDRQALTQWFAAVEYPLYFIDYETYASAFPIVHGARPQSPIPFQYSLHIKQSPEDTELVHVEYLAEEAALPSAMIAHMEQHIGPTGSVISWHSSFENTQNRTMATQFPAKAAFLQGLVDRTLDLELVFKTAYVDIAFGGSTSIKKVLPVLAPELNYDGLDIANGTDAMIGWKRLIDLPDGDEKNALRTAMLAYCKLDTYAMVRIFEAMQRV
jgi:hypothetical protein